MKTDYSIDPEPLETAVLFIVYNRPRETRLAFEAIKRVKPNRLYVAIDGPREEDKQRRDEVLEIVSIVDWECEVNYRLPESNLGCGLAVSSAITWFFEHEHEGIIIEDDCIPQQSFFYFAQYLLEKYRFNDEVFMISGSRLAPNQESPKQSYSFSNTVNIWGWATWRRAWMHYDYSMVDWRQEESKNTVSELGFGDYNFVAAWNRVFDLAHLGVTGSWDHQWVYAMWKNKGMSIIPSINLIQNIGSTSSRSVSKNKNKFVPVSEHNFLLNELKFPIVSPTLIAADRELESWYFSNVYNYPGAYLKHTIRRITGLFGRWNVIKK